MKYIITEDFDGRSLIVEAPEERGMGSVVAAKTITEGDAAMVVQGLEMVRLHHSLNIITICGSMRFFGEMLEEAQRHTLAGAVVLMPFIVTTVERTDEETKRALDLLHYRKIDLSDAIMVVNPSGYIGDSTRNEIEYAVAHGKEVMSMEPLPDDLGD